MKMKKMIVVGIDVSDFFSIDRTRDLLVQKIQRNCCCRQPKEAVR
jgi:hypothetical protein